jgi:cyclin-dependent kinase 12/13
VAMISKLLTLDPSLRWSAEQALDAEYFFENPIVKPADKLSMNFGVSAVHEWECRRRYEQKVRAQQAKSAAASIPPATTG